MDVVAHGGPARPPLAERVRDRLGTLVAAAVALVLVAAAVTLSVRIDDVAGARLQTLGPGLDAAMSDRGLRILPERPFARPPCRLNALVGAVESRSLRRTYNTTYGQGNVRQVEVAVYLMGDPEARLRAVERGLRHCGGFDSTFGDAPYRFTITDVALDGHTLRWRLEGRNERVFSYAHARLFVSGPHVVYVLDHRLFEEPPPGAADEIARVVAEAIAGTGPNPAA